MLSKSSGGMRVDAILVYLKEAQSVVSRIAGFETDAQSTAPQSRDVTCGASC